MGEHGALFGGDKKYITSGTKSKTLKIRGLLGEINTNGKITLRQFIRSSM
jgi:hypothetical protein